MFMDQALHLLHTNGVYAMINQQAWMFLSSFDVLRANLLENNTIHSMAHMGFGAFGADFGTTSFVVKKSLINGYISTFLSLREDKKLLEKKNLFLLRKHLFSISASNFKKIPGSPIAYWISHRLLQYFEKCPNFYSVAPTKQGLATGNNDLFLKFWNEVSTSNFSVFNSDNKKWFPCNKGGSYRKWFGNNEYIVNWENDGYEIQNYKDKNGKLLSRPQNKQFYFNEGITWSSLSSSRLSMRYSPKGFIFETKGSMAFPLTNDLIYLTLGFMNSSVVNKCLEVLAPTLDFHEGPIGKLPWVEPKNKNTIIHNSLRLVDIAKSDWDAYETSWDFEKLPIIRNEFKKDTIGSSYNAWRTQSLADIAEMKLLEEENNELFINTYGLQDELMPDVPLEQITLTVNPRYRYKSDASDEELEARFKTDTIKELISYAIGCAMGRYSLDKGGLVYANEKGEGFNPADYRTYPADGDGIIPVTDTAWFPEEDAVERLVKFIKTVWGEDTLAENLEFIANALDKKPTETSVDAIRRYITKDFYKDHLQTYKNRPIYWLFSSGKEKAFECLVYMHRMNAQTLARIRMEFIVPLMSKFEATLAKLEQDLPLAESTASRKIIEKQIDKLTKQKHELVNYDDVINHAINERIEMDLDDGVKVNYAKFANLLAESKKIVGK